jgi:DNA-binding Xre family transcriptional regulator
MIKTRIKELAAKKGITSAYQLQQFLGVHATDAYRLFGDEMKSISLKNIELLCIKFKCKPNNLFDIQEDKT